MRGTCGSREINFIDGRMASISLADCRKVAACERGSWMRIAASSEVVSKRLALIATSAHHHHAQNGIAQAQEQRQEAQVVVIVVVIVSSSSQVCALCGRPFVAAAVEAERRRRIRL